LKAIDGNQFPWWVFLLAEILDFGTQEIFGVFSLVHLFTMISIKLVFCFPIVYRRVKALFQHPLVSVMAPYLVVAGVHLGIKYTFGMFSTMHLLSILTVVIMGVLFHFPSVHRRVKAVFQHPIVSGMTPFCVISGVHLGIKYTFGVFSTMHLVSTLTMILLGVLFSRGHFDRRVDAL
jgi:hypothetical protein